MNLNLTKYANKNIWQFTSNYFLHTFWKVFGKQREKFHERRSTICAWKISRIPVKLIIKSPTNIYVYGRGSTHAAALMLAKEWTKGGGKKVVGTGRKESERDRKARAPRLPQFRDVIHNPASKCARAALERNSSVSAAAVQSLQLQRNAAHYSGARRRRPPKKRASLSPPVPLTPSLPSYLRLSFYRLSFSVCLTRALSTSSAGKQASFI